MAVKLMWCLQALDVVLQLQPHNADALCKRAAVHAEAGCHQASFYDLKRVSELSPKYPGILLKLQRAARHCSEGRKATVLVTAPHKQYSRIRRARSMGAAGCGAPHHAASADRDRQELYQVLGITAGASTQDLKRAFKQLATKLHPDKWMQATIEARAAAEEQFKAVNAAYHTLIAGT